MCFLPAESSTHLGGGSTIPPRESQVSPVVPASRGEPAWQDALASQREPVLRGEPSRARDFADSKELVAPKGPGRCSLPWRMAFTSPTRSAR